MNLQELQALSERGENPTIRPGEWYFELGELRFGPFGDEDEAWLKRAKVLQNCAPFLRGEFTEPVYNNLAELGVKNPVIEGWDHNPIFE